MNNADYFDVFNSIKGLCHEMNISLKAFKVKSKLSKQACVVVIKLLAVLKTLIILKIVPKAA
jgi:hypothetical protein